jgi:hypothetical protein
MNHPSEARGAENQADLSAEGRLRKRLLHSGLFDLVPLAEVESVITGEHLAATTTEQQELALSLMRSVINDGLMEFEGWGDLLFDEAMARVHDDPGMWAFAVSLKLTEAGKRIAAELKARPAN